MKKKLDVLVLTPFYDIFAKELINATSNHVREINVIVHHNRLSELSKYIPLKGYMNHVKRFTKDNILNIKGKPENVNVHLEHLIYFIPDGSNQYLGDKIAKKVEQKIKKEKLHFDIIHAHFTWPCGYAAIYLGKKFNVPAIITIHENRDWLIKEYNSNNKRIYWTWKNADALIRVNKKDIPLLQEFNDTVYAIPNGFNPKKFSLLDQRKARKILDLPPEKKIIFSLGYLNERKGFQFLIESISKIKEKREDILCVIGGKGPMKSKLKEKINKLSLGDYVKLIGFIPDKKVNLWFNAADFFVLPSLSEGNPTVMFEALGIGLPFIGTKVGGIPEIITSKDYGLLVNPADTKDLTEKILITLEKEWNKKSIRKYAERFTWERISEKYIELYANLVKEDF